MGHGALVGRRTHGFEQVRAEDARHCDRYLDARAGKLGGKTR